MAVKFEELLYQFTLLCVDMGSFFYFYLLFKGRLPSRPLKNQSDEIDKAYLCAPYLITRCIKAAIPGVHSCFMQYNSICYPHSAFVITRAATGRCLTHVVLTAALQKTYSWMHQCHWAGRHALLLAFHTSQSKLLELGFKHS